MYPQPSIMHSMAKSTLPQPPVGAILHWFAEGNPNREPFPALVVANNGNGKVNIVVFQPHPIYFQSVWYMHDPAIAKTPVENRGRVGAWDYIPDCGSPPDLRKAADEKSKVDEFVAQQRAKK
jgi:hypothetical protein